MTLIRLIITDKYGAGLSVKIRKIMKISGKVFVGTTFDICRSPSIAAY